MRLLLVSGGEYGAPGSLYRTEVDSYVVVTAIGGTLGEPDYFSVRAKDGSTTYYGGEGAHNSEQTAYNASGDAQLDKVLSWKIQEFKDSTSNPIRYFYSVLESEHFPTEVRYAYSRNGVEHAKVVFGYAVGARPDASSGYSAGYLFKQTKLLESVESFNYVNTEWESIRRYELSYKPSSATANDLISRLESIQMCGGGVCHEGVTTQFLWGGGAIGIDGSYEEFDFATADDTYLLDHKQLDINGDGRLDIAWLEYRPEGDGIHSYWIYSKIAGESSRYEVFNARGYNAEPTKRSLTVLDYNVDGRSDLVYHGILFQSMAQGNGTWDLKHSINLSLMDRYKPHFADVNSDGLPDEVNLEGSTLSVRLLEKSPTATPTSHRSYRFASVEEFTLASGSQGDHFIESNFTLADYNGDGNADLFVNVRRDLGLREEYGAVFRRIRDFGLLFVMDWEAKEFRLRKTIGIDNEYSAGVNSSISGDARSKILPSVDVNGDGLPDLIVRDFLTGYWRYALNKGAGQGFAGFVNIARKEGNSAPLVTWVDMNRDGYLDFVWRTRSSDNTDKIYYNLWDPARNGYGVRERLAIAYDPDNEDSYSVFDHNGDGYLDLITFDGGEKVITVRNGRVPTDGDAFLIQNIIDGMGNETEIEYEPLVHSGHYTSLQTLTTSGGHVCTDYSTPGGPVEYCRYEAAVAQDVDAFYEQINQPFGDLGSEPYLEPERYSPIMELAGPAPIVTNVYSSSPHAANPTAKVGLSYFYHQLRLQAAGRGVLGFRKLSTLDHQTGITTSTTYRQDWPFIGMPRETVTKSAEGKILKSSSNQHAVRHQEALIPGPSKGYGPIQIWPQSTTETVYALSNNGAYSGAPVSVTKTEVNQDADGNVTNMEVTVKNVAGIIGRVVTTENEYHDSDEGRFLGRLMSAQVTTAHQAVPNRPSTIGETRTSTFGYYNFGAACTSANEDLSGLLCEETIEGSHTTRHHYDAFGNKTYASTFDPISGRTRTSAYSQYDESGRHVEYTYNHFDIEGSDASVPDSTYLSAAQGRVMWVGEVLSRNRYGAATSTKSYTGSRWLTNQAYFTDFGVGYLSASNDGNYNVSLSSRTNLAYCPTLTAFSTVERAPGGGEGKACFDSLGRNLRNISFDIERRRIFQDTEYDLAGRAYRVSEPYRAASDGGTGTRYWTTVLNYDLLGRATETELPFFETDTEGNPSAQRAVANVTFNDSALTTTYTGPRVTGGNGPERLTKTEIRNVLGDIISVEEFESEGGALVPVVAHYYHDVFGKLKSMLGSSGESTTIDYNALGQKERMLDPDKGEWLYRYNGFGELICQRDAKNQVTKNEHDFKGRLVKRTDYAAGSPDACDSVGGLGDAVNIAEWEYDTAPDGLGKLALEFDSSGYRNAYIYDAKGRNSITETVIPGDHIQPGGSHFTKVTYDEYGRVFQNFDAARTGQDFTRNAVKNTYKNGHLWQVRNADQNASFGNDVYYEVAAMNGRGQVSQAVYADGNTTTTTTYNDRTGRVEAIETLSALHDRIQFLTMRWDTLGNLTSRTDAGENSNGSGRHQHEQFTYDERNRLTGYHIAGNESDSISVDYNALGNITAKSDVGEYAYEGYGPHAVSRAGDRRYEYDSNGSMTHETEAGRSGVRRAFEYRTFDKVSKITNADSSTTEFFYGTGRNRYKRIDTDSDPLNNNREVVTVYLGSVEKIYNADATQQWRRTLAGGLQITHKFVNHHYQSTETQVFHKDHLGSVNTITDSLGGIQQHMAFDPWGARRNAFNWNEALADISQFHVSVKPITTRGFTGHEMVDEMEIIHMNGRIYDARLGRFLQADPVIQAPTMIGSLNRYSYVMNNPLNATDPSGFNWVSDRWHAIKDNGGKMLLAAVASYFTFGAVQSWMMAQQISSISYLTGVAVNVYSAGAAVYSGIVAGAVSGFVGGAISGGTLKSGIQGAISGAIFGGIGAGFVGDKAGSAGHYASHALAGGILEELQGGEFGHGFISAGLTKMVMFNAGSRFEGLELGSILGRTFAAAAVGGTISAATGGKFGNGARTAAYAHLLNAESTNAIAQKELPEIFKDEQFKNTLASGLNLAEGDVETRYQLQGDNISSGSVIRYKEASWFSSKEGYYVDGMPSSNTVRGLTETGGFASALQPLEGAKALAISVNRWTGDRGITNINSVNRFNALSRYVNAPVIVTGRGAGIYVFDGGKGYAEFKF